MESSRDKRESTIEGTRARIQHWRQTRQKRSPMPEDLWAEAVDLAAEHGIHRISKQLGVAYQSLKKRVMKSDGAAACGLEELGGFIEISGSSFASGLLSAQTVLELRRGDGASLILRQTSQQALDLAALVTSFLR